MLDRLRTETVLVWGAAQAAAQVALVQLGDLSVVAHSYAAAAVAIVTAYIVRARA